MGDKAERGVLAGGSLAKMLSIDFRLKHESAVIEVCLLRL